MYGVRVKISTPYHELDFFILDGKTGGTVSYHSTYRREGSYCECGWKHRRADTNKLLIAEAVAAMKEVLGEEAAFPDVLWKSHAARAFKAL